MNAISPAAIRSRALEANRFSRPRQPRSRSFQTMIQKLMRNRRPIARRCPHCRGQVRLEPSVNFLVCKVCCELLYANELKA